MKRIPVIAATLAIAAALVATATAAAAVVTSTQSDADIMGLDASEYSALGITTSPVEVGEGDPLHGYSPSILSELYVRTQQKGGKSNVMLEENATSLSQLNDGDVTVRQQPILHKDEKAEGSELLYNKEVKEKDEGYDLQFTNTVAVTVDSQQHQVIVENSLWHAKKKSHQELRTLTYTESGDLASGVVVSKEISDNSDWVSGITIREQRGMGAMSVGDYDHDGTDEVAVYCPAGNLKNTGCIDIYDLIPTIKGDLVTYTPEKIEPSIPLSRLDDNNYSYDYTYDKSRALVDLTTVSESGQDDLVVNVSFPYDNYSTCANAGAIGIFRYNGSGFDLSFHDHMDLTEGTGSERTIVKMQSACEADLNNDGTDELVVAGYKNTKMKVHDSRGDLSQGDKGVNLINVVLWDAETKAYYWAWGATGFKEVSCCKDVDPDSSHGKGDSENSNLSLAAGKFFGTAEPDVLFVNGRFVRAECSFDGNAGVEKAVLKASDKDPQIQISGGDEFIYDAIVGNFSEDQDERATDQIIVVRGRNGTSSDYVSLDVQLFQGKDVGESTKVCMELIRTITYFIDNGNEDDDGTCLDICPVNVDDDTVFIKYKSTTTTWAQPTVLAVLQAQPYWRDLETKSSNYTDVTTSKTTSSSESSNWNVGGGFGFSVSWLVGFMGNGGGFGIDFQAAGSYVNTHAETNSSTQSVTFRGTNNADSVALLTVPQVIYAYDLYLPAHKATQAEVDAGGAKTVGEDVPAQTVEWNVTEQRDSCVSIVPVTTYNSVAESHNAKIGDDEAPMDKIDTTAIFGTYTPGDPTTYPSSSAVYVSNAAKSMGINDSDVKVYSTDRWIEVQSKASGNVTAAISNSTTIADTEGYKIDVNGKLKAEAGVGCIAHIKGSVFGLAQGGGGQTWTNSDASAWTVSTCFTPLPKSTGTADVYDYSAKSVEWIYDQKTGFKDADGNYQYTQIPVVGYVTNCSAPEYLAPPLPNKFRVASSTRETISLLWENVESSTRPAVSYYKLLWSDAADGDYHYLKDENGTDLQIPGDQAYYVVSGLDEGTGYYFKIQAVSAQGIKSNISTSVGGVTKGIADEPVILKSPRDCEVVTGQVPSFTVEAESSVTGKTDSLEYQWQVLNNTTWSDVNVNSNASAGQATFYPAGCVGDAGVAITEASAAELDGNIYRCVVSDRVSAVKYTSVTTCCVQLRANESRTKVVLEVSSNKTNVSPGTDEATFSVAMVDGSAKAIGGRTAYVVAENMATGETMELGAVTLDNEGKGSLKSTFATLGNYKVIAASLQTEEYYRSASDAIDLFVDTATFNITYELDGGVNAASNPTSVSAASSTVTLSDPERTGYTFAGWYYDAEHSKPVVDGVLDPASMTGDVTLYAAWTGNEYKITYHLDGGTNAKGNPSTFTYGQTTVVKPPAKTGYDFAGWYLDEGLTQRFYGVIDANAFAEDIDLYATWTLATYTIQYRLHGGSDGGANPTTYTIEDDAITLVAPQRDYGVFVGWTELDGAGALVEGDEDVWTINTSKGGNLVINAKWQADERSVTWEWDWSGDEPTCTAKVRSDRFPNYYATVEAEVSCDVTTAPTCISTGLGDYTATAMGFSDTKKDIALPVDPEAHAGETEIRDQAEPTCMQLGNTGDLCCVDCGVVIEAGQILPKDASVHLRTEVQGRYQATRLMFGSTGNEVCLDCGSIVNLGHVVAPVTFIKLSKTHYTYDGKVKKPRVIVQDAYGVDLSPLSYAVTYDGSAKVGKHTVKVQLMGDYAGSAELTYVVGPKGTSIKSLKSLRRGFKATWKKQAKQTTGYQVRYSKYKDFSGAVTGMISSNKDTSWTVRKLKAKQKYYVKVRTYKVVNGKRYHSSWSKAKVVRTK